MNLDGETRPYALVRESRGWRHVQFPLDELGLSFLGKVFDIFPGQLAPDFRGNSHSIACIGF
jgi:hypothetical protein